MSCVSSLVLTVVQPLSPQFWVLGSKIRNQRPKNQKFKKEMEGKGAKKRMQGSEITPKPEQSLFPSPQPILFPRDFFSFACDSPRWKVSCRF